MLEEKILGLKSCNLVFYAKQIAINYMRGLHNTCMVCFFLQDRISLQTLSDSEETTKSIFCFIYCLALSIPNKTSESLVDSL